MKRFPPTRQPNAARAKRGLRTAAILASGGIFLAAIAPRAAAQAAEASITASLAVEKRAVFTRELFPVTLTITASGVGLGQQFSLQGLPDERQLKFGTFRELPAQRERRGDRQVEIRRFTSDAQAVEPGDFTLAPVLQVGIMVRRWGLFGPFTEEVQQSLPVQPLAITARAPPEQGRPAGFSGAVGQFAMEADVAPTDVAVGDLVQVTARIRGKGDLQGARPPRIAPGEGFKVYEPKVMSEQGEGVWRCEQTLVPQSTNATAIPAVSFTFFDPLSEAYRTVSRGPFALHFHARASVAFVPYKPAAGEKVKPAPGAAPASAAPAGLRYLPAAAYWAVMLIVAVALAARGRRGAILAALWLVIAVPLFLGLVKASRARAREAAGTTLQREERGRIAPAFSALETFALPSGAVVRVVGVAGTWSRITTGDKSGWVPTEAIQGNVSCEDVYRKGLKRL